MHSNIINLVYEVIHMPCVCCDIMRWFLLIGLVKLTLFPLCFFQDRSSKVEFWTVRSQRALCLVSTIVTY